jgi:hypothetical protein
VSKRRSQSPRQRKQGQNTSPGPPAASANVAPVVADMSRQAMSSEAPPPPPPSELDELDAGWDELLV